MKNRNFRSDQAGASLVVSLIMLVVITLLALSAINSSTVNLRIVGNVQARDEARAAGQAAIEQFVSSYANFYPTPPAGVTVINVDLDNNGATDFAVSVAKPICRQAAQQVPPKSIACANGYKSGLICWDTLWDVEATATNAKSGVSQIVTQGIALTFDPSFDPSSVGC